MDSTKKVSKYRQITTNEENMHENPIVRAQETVCTCEPTVPEHIEGTNMDENAMPDPFQALPGAKTALKHF